MTADGWPVVQLFRSRGLDLERVTGSEWLSRAVGSNALAGHRVGLLGGSHDVGARFKRILGESLVFREHGNRDEWSATQIAEDATRMDVDVLLVAVTPPYGDLIAMKLVDAGYVGTVMSVGGGVDMLVGAQRAAPEWLKRFGLEWFARLSANPRRLWRRYFVECMPTFVRVIVPALVVRTPSAPASSYEGVR
ncbi:WecB/TagA/CpsF family glycosyltransferase [Agromyces protaetiae]|uniref:WecB/TagA/CpsF family glycosyltransferase n=1 Tax=Agromyces protaetiae TaxID=2509455 RepID=UPI003C7CCF33